MATASVGISLTKNLGNYNSLKIEMGMQDLDPANLKEDIKSAVKAIDEAMPVLVEKADNQVQELSS